VDATHRLFVFFVGGALLACAGAPAVHTTAITVQWQAAAGGAYLGGCLRGAVVIAARSHAVERWSFPPNAPPRRLDVSPLSPIGRGVITGLRCHPDGDVVATSDGRRLTLLATGLAEREEEASATPHLPTVSAEVPASGTRFEAQLPDGRQVVLGAWGRGLRQGDAFVDWRPVPGRLADATFDGESVWAVGRGGLWRWRPGRPGVMPVALPSGLADRPLVGVFRDGPLLWVRDAAGTGWPLSVRGGVATMAGESGTLPPASVSLRARLGAWRLWATRGEPGLQLIDAKERAKSVHTAPVEGLFPVDGSHCLVADRDRLTLWRADDAGEPTRVAHWAYGGPVLRAFVDGQRVHLVGRPFGFMTGALVPVKETRTKRSR
jgi:hypothetical protein